MNRDWQALVTTTSIMLDMSAIPGCQCGCGEPTIRATYTARQSGIIKGQFREYLPYHKPRPLTSLIWTVSREELEQIVQESESVIDIMRRLGYTNTPGSRYPSLYARLEQEGIEVPVYKRKESLHLIKEARPLEEVLIENSTYSRYALKRRLIKEKNTGRKV